MGRQPTRRRTLALLGSGLVAAAGGCSGFSDDGVRSVTTLTPAGGRPGDAFGWDVALSDSRALVGAPHAADGGMAYAYGLDGGISETRLDPADRVPGFGRTVALDGARALVGAPATADPSARGRAYVFDHTGDSWRQRATLAAPDGTPHDAFGWDVALAGGWALVGARGTDRADRPGAGVAHVFEATDDGWRHRAALAPRTADAYAYAGGSVALGGETALLGSLLSDTEGTDAGSATPFERAGDTWRERATFTAPDAAPGDRFGNAVALDSETALVGAVGRGGGPDAPANDGGAYRFARTDDGWRHRATLAPQDPDAAFGIDVALTDERALVGAFAGGSDGGRAILYEGESWDRRATLTPTDGDPGDGFGGAVALTGDRALVGATDDGGTGSATLFEL